MYMEIPPQQYYKIRTSDDMGRRSNKMGLFRYGQLEYRRYPQFLYNLRVRNRGFNRMRFAHIVLAR